VFNRLVTRIGVRNVALIQPAAYFAVFAYFFLAGGTAAALAAFFAYHGVLTSIEYNNQNLLFNATPSPVKRPFRTVVEGLCEPLASLVAGGFLLLAARHMGLRELAGVGVLLGAALLAVVTALRLLYPAAMEANMRRGWLNFGEARAQTLVFAPDAVALLREKTQEPDSATAAAARNLLHLGAAKPSTRAEIAVEDSAATDEFATKLADPSPSVRRYALQALVSVAGPGDIGLVGPLTAALPHADRESRATILEILGAIGDVEAIPQVLAAAARLSPRELRAAETLLTGLGEAAIPRLMQAMALDTLAYRGRAVAARALAALSPAQFASQLDRLVAEELDQTGPRLAVAARFEAEPDASPALQLLARADRERIAASVDFVLELLALGGRLPDFDLLVVSLHSANPKVRANAIESIASGLDHATWRRLEPLIHGRTTRSDARTGDLVPLLAEAIRDGVGFEAVAAAQALRDHAPADATPERLRSALRPGLSLSLKAAVATLLLGDTETPTVVDLIDALRREPDFGAATLEALLALAERARPEASGRKPRQVVAKGRAFWLAKADVDEVAARYPDLALTLLKAGDGRAYAA
jgi:hypothetical protein